MSWIAAVTVEMGGFSKSASNSRLESGSGVCFVGVTVVSNRSDSRLESISRRAESSARTRWGFGCFVCFVGVTLGVGWLGFRLGFGSEATVWCSTITRLLGGT